MKTSNALWLAPLLGMLAMPVLADDNGYKGYGHREDRQQARIEQGIRKGDLNRHEARKLQHEQRRIAKDARDYRRDGQLDRHERRDLKQQRADASRHIYRARHNDRDRGHYRKYDKHDHRYRDRGKHYGWHHHSHQRWPGYYGYRHGHAERGRYYDDGSWWVMFGLRDGL